MKDVLNSWNLVLYCLCMVIEQMKNDSRSL